MRSENAWRHLSAAEIESLIQQQNCADDWNAILVTDTFCVSAIRHCGFFGTIYIGSNVTLYHVHFLANYYFDEGCRVMNVQKMTTIEDISQRFHFQIAVRNENGEHIVSASPDMNIAGAYLMTLCGDHPSAGTRLSSLISKDEHFPYKGIGYVGKQALVENVNCIENVWVGEMAVLSECAKLQNTFIHSSAKEPAQIGVGVILRNVIVSNGCTIDTGAIVRNSFLGCHVSLFDYARVSHCVVGDNSRIACCEVLHSLLFPFHEQHHNNSFLIASWIKGQSNIAAGATLGSNHNGRANDCEMVAGRGFWAGLCTNVKFPSVFASYTLLAKAEYPYELRQPFPFSLLNNNQHDNVLEIMPAYWWMFNTYALFRNAWKYNNRDKRVRFSQYIHYAPLAPDTVLEILQAMPLLQQWRQTQTLPYKMERSHRQVRILKSDEAMTAYNEMLSVYCLKTLHSLYSSALHAEEAMIAFVHRIAQTSSYKNLFNVGGQLVWQSDLDDLMTMLSRHDSEMSSWQDFTDYMTALYRKYDADNQMLAFYVLNQLMQNTPITAATVKVFFDNGHRIVRKACERALSERERDLNDDFRKAASCTSTMSNDEVLTYIRHLLQESFSEIQ